MNEKKYSYIINLKHIVEMDIHWDFNKTDYSEAKDFSDSELVHRKIFQQALPVFSNLYDYAVKISSESSCDIPHVHNTISILGSRGTGKTSFMLSLIRMIKEQKKNDILCINPIDPSHVESKQHPFVNIISSIQEEVEAMLQTIREEPRLVEHIDSGIQKDFNNYYSALLRGLKVIEGIGKEHLYDEWNDDEYISMLGMDNAKATVKLETNFHKYIYYALKILKKKCILIAFDDIDIDYQKGFQILEVIRKYLTTPQLITIITGDQGLYTTLVRKHQWQFFDKDYIDKEKAYAENEPKEFAEMVDHLENQYMAKVLKPENRINLLSIQEYLQDSDYHIYLKFKEGESEETLTDCYRNIMCAMGAQSASVDDVVRFMTSLSLRVQVRILTLWKNSLALPSEKEQQHYLTAGFLNVFSTDIYQKSENARELLNGREKYTIEMLRLLTFNNCLHSSCSFLPITSDLILNKALLAVGLKFDEYLQTNSYLIFDYWARICYAKVLAEQLGSGGKTRFRSGDKALNSEGIVQNLMSYGQLDADVDISKSVGLCEAFYCSQRQIDDLKTNFPGCVYINKAIPRELAANDDQLSLMSMMGIVDMWQEETAVVSIYRVMALISEIMLEIKLHQGNPEWEGATFLNIIGQYKKYIEPTLPYARTEHTYSEDFEQKDWHYSSNADDRLSYESLFNAMAKWVAYPVKASVEKLNRIFTRFYFFVLHQENDGYITLGTRWNDIVLTLLNAAIVEDGIEYGWDKLDINQFGDISHIYMKNWNVLQANYNEELCFSGWLVNCPLLKLYIRPLILKMIENNRWSTGESMADLLSYDQWEYEIEGIQLKLSKIEVFCKEEEEMLAQLDVLDKYHALKQAQSSYQFLIDQAKEKKDVKSLAIYQKRLNEVEKELEDKVAPAAQLVATQERNMSILADRDELERLRMDTLENYYRHQEEKDRLDQRREQLILAKSGISSFVVADNEHMKALADPPSLFPLYNTIPISTK